MGIMDKVDKNKKDAYNYLKQTYLFGSFRTDLSQNTI